MAKGKEKAGTSTRSSTRKRTREQAEAFENEDGNADAGPGPSTLAISATTESSAPVSAKRSRHRAETRECPICHEPIPLRLLSKHAELEASRVQDIINTVGSLEPITTTSEFDLGFYVPAATEQSTTRRSAARARQTIRVEVSGSSRSSTTPASKTIQAIKRNRKQRHAKLKEMTKDEEDIVEASHRAALARGATETVCPVCLTMVRGDEDVVNAHVDACLAHEAQRAAEERERQALIEQEMANAAVDDDMMVDIDGEAVGHIGDVRGTGFHTRDRNVQDIDDEIDIDGDDSFGDAQFTEGDVVPLPERPNLVASIQDEEVQIDGGEDQQQPDITLRDLIAEGKVLKKNAEGEGSEKAQVDQVMGLAESDQLDLAILAARRQKNQPALIAALENKVSQLESTRVSSSTTLLCRICIDPYNEPTVSTGCWHTCCRECWLRCLGSTKLCPICKRITAASDLRRVYL